MALVFCLLLMSITLRAQLTYAAKARSLIQVWGLLKYHHPAVTGGKLDWDDAFQRQYEPVMAAKTKQELDELYTKWIQSLGPIGQPRIVPATEKNANLTNEWLSDTALYTRELSAWLARVLNAKSRKNWYAHTRLSRKSTPRNIPYFDHELVYKDSVYPGPAMRLLAMARYWNVIQYLYPYKFLLREQWDKVAEEMAPAFIHAADTVSYHLAMQQLVVKIQDNHAYFNTRYTLQRAGVFWPAFYLAFAGDTAVVAGYWPDSLATLDDIRKGDIVLAIDGRRIIDILHANADWITGGNEVARKRNAHLLLNGDADTCVLTIVRDGQPMKQTVHRYRMLPVVQPATATKERSSRIIDDSIGYVDMGRLQPKEVKRTMRALDDKKAIIFDLRKYPNWTIYKVTKYLMPERTGFAVFTMPVTKNAGGFKAMKPTKCGKRNAGYYKGRVVILMDEHTQSRAEFTAMALRKAPQAVTIGRPTAGADGDVRNVPLPGNLHTWISGYGVYDVNGSCPQISGLEPDIVVPATVAAMSGKRDDVLERALQYVKTGM